MLELSSSPPPAPPASASTVALSGTARQPPYSAQGDCRRDYDRDGHGDGFARCGTSCCRSSSGIPCYYKADPGLCDRFLGDGGGGAGGNGAGGDGEIGAETPRRREGDDGGGPDPMAHALARRSRSSRAAGQLVS